MQIMKLCMVAHLAEGEMRDFQVDGKEVIVVWCRGAEPRAFDAACPHEGVSLAYGDFDGSKVVCGAHGWSFDAHTGKCVFPGGCGLTSYPLRIDGDYVFIDLHGVGPTQAFHTDKV